MISGVTAEICEDNADTPHSFSIALISKKTFKTKIPRMAQIYGHCLILEEVHPALMGMKGAILTQYFQGQKLNYLRHHFTEIRYE